MNASIAPQEARPGMSLPRSRGLVGIKVARAALFSLGLALAGAAAAEGVGQAPVAASQAPSSVETVNINKADAAALARVLKGVGQSKAEAIVAYRNEHGEFVDVYELANVKGIGERTVEQNESRIMLKD